jgi:hypothetical protein
VVGLFSLVLGFVLASQQISKKQLDIDVQLVEETE